MEIKVIFHHLSVETLLFSKSISTDTSNNRDGVMVESSWTSFDFHRKKKEKKPYLAISMILDSADF